MRNEISPNGRDWVRFIAAPFCIVKCHARLMKSPGEGRHGRARAAA
ncbi:hypothetical protein BN2497_11811 [Janthinobacterium sp. CG23_2]|nr:hypothetical protein BN2497_11811 [Janthinobacterium sp. CG23_2]CUU32303.1 hypothetical protein BN3177_11811 [Janthinobacterium sp. CG23_2]